MVDVFVNVCFVMAIETNNSTFVKTNQWNIKVCDLCQTCNKLQNISKSLPTKNIYTYSYAAVTSVLNYLCTHQLISTHLLPSPPISSHLPTSTLVAFHFLFLYCHMELKRHGICLTTALLAFSRTPSLQPNTKYNIYIPVAADFGSTRECCRPQFA